MPDRDFRIKVQVTLPPEARSFSEASLWIQIEKIGEIDAPAEIVARTPLPGISHVQGEAFLSRGEIVLQEVDPAATYEVSAHLDLDHDETVSRGDWITMQSYPLSLAEPEEELTLTLKQIT